MLIPHFKRIWLKSLALIVSTASLSLLTLSAQAFSLPDDDPLSGQFINVSRGLGTLGDIGGTEAFNITIIVPNTDGDDSVLSEALIIDIFDGNLTGFWDLNLLHDEQTFRLFKDPTATGNTAAVDEIALINNNSASMPDNAFVNIFSGTVDPGTYNAVRDAYVYHLVAEWDTLLVTDESNVFKVRVNDPATPVILAGSSVGLIGLDSFTGDLGLALDTSYIGDVVFRVIVPDAGGTTCNLLMYNGDLDHADDTDDANSPPMPPFATSPLTLNQGVNLGAPLDDNANLDLVRSPDVFIEVVGPNGSYLVTDPDPSGNREWELFHIASNAVACQPVDPTADVVVASLDPGLHTVTLKGLDSFNNVFFNANVDIVPGPPVDDCFDCNGKVTTLTLQNNGDATDVQVFQRGVTDPIFDGTVSAGGLLVLNPTPGDDTLGTEISFITADGVCAATSNGNGKGNGKGKNRQRIKSNCSFHTSCSVPIGPGSISGPFEVVSGESRNGGLLCPLDMQSSNFSPVP